MSEKAPKPKEVRDVNQAFDPEHRQAQNEWDAYLSGRPTQLSNGTAKNPDNGQFISPDKYFDGVRADAFTDTQETDYEDLGPSDLARMLGEAQAHGDKTTAIHIEEVLTNKIVEKIESTKDANDPNSKGWDNDEAKGTEDDMVNAYLDHLQKIQDDAAEAESLRIHGGEDDASTTAVPPLPDAPREAAADTQEDETETEHVETGTTSSRAPVVPPVPEATSPPNTQDKPEVPPLPDAPFGPEEAEARRQQREASVDSTQEEISQDELDDFAENAGRVAGETPKYDGQSQDKQGKQPQDHVDATIPIHGRREHAGLERSEEEIEAIDAIQKAQANGNEDAEKAARQALSNTVKPKNGKHTPEEPVKEPIIEGEFGPTMKDGTPVEERGNKLTKFARNYIDAYRNFKQARDENNKNNIDSTSRAYRAGRAFGRFKNWLKQSEEVEVASRSPFVDKETASSEENKPKQVSDRDKDILASRKRRLETIDMVGEGTDLEPFTPFEDAKSEISPVLRGLLEVNTGDKNVEISRQEFALERIRAIYNKQKNEMLDSEQKAMENFINKVSKRQASTNASTISIKDLSPSAEDQQLTLDTSKAKEENSIAKNDPVEDEADNRQEDEPYEFNYDQINEIAQLNSAGETGKAAEILFNAMSDLDLVYGDNPAQAEEEKAKFEQAVADAMSRTSQINSTKEDAGNNGNGETNGSRSEKININDLDDLEANAGVVAGETARL